MNDFQKLLEQLRAVGLDPKVEGPDSAAVRWLDVGYVGRDVAVEWRLGEGFGVSRIESGDDPSSGLFEGPDEILRDVEAARARILILLEFDEEPSFLPKAAMR